MEENLHVFLNKFEERLTDILVEQASSLRFLNGNLLQSDDLENMWHRIAAEYMNDAVPNIIDYPTVSVAWAGYLGLAMAHLWDKNWNDIYNSENPYERIRNPRGFDEMDEYITEEIIGYKCGSNTVDNLANLMRTMAHTSIGLIRKENLDPLSESAFHLYARTVKVMYRMGVSIELYRLGYKYEKII